MRYWPVLSLVAVRTFSISAGLVTSTSTPGTTPPDESLTVPAMLPPCWASAAAGSSIRSAARVNDAFRTRYIASPPIPEGREAPHHARLSAMSTLGPVAAGLQGPGQTLPDPPTLYCPRCGALFTPWHRDCQDSC